MAQLTTKNLEARIKRLWYYNAAALQIQKRNRGTPDVDAAAADVTRHVLRDPGVSGRLRARDARELTVGDADHDLDAASGERAQHARVGVEELHLADPVGPHQVHHHARRRAVRGYGAPVHPDRCVGWPPDAEGDQDDGCEQRGGSSGHFGAFRIRDLWRIGRCVLGSKLDL